MIAAALLLYVVPVYAAFRTAPAGTRSRLAAVYVTAVGISVLFGLVLPRELASGANYVGLFFGGVALGGVVGLGSGLSRPKGGVFRQLLLGTLGGGTFLALAFGGLIFLLATTGACLD